MVWEKRYLLGGIEGWENYTSKDTIHVEHKVGWKVVLNNKTIHRGLKTEKEAILLMKKRMDHISDIITSRFSSNGGGF